MHHLFYSSIQKNLNSFNKKTLKKQPKARTLCVGKLCLLILFSSSQENNAEKQNSMFPNFFFLRHKLGSKKKKNEQIRAIYLYVGCPGEETG